MMKTSNLKTSDTTIRVGKFLLELLNNPMSYDEMLKFFENKVENPVYTKEVLSKYLNTLRALGLEISKYKSKYYLLNFLFQINLNKEEIKAFNDIETSILRYGTDKNIKVFYDFKKKAIKFISPNSRKEINNYVEKFLTTDIGIKIKQFGKFCNDEQLLKISYEDEIIIVEPTQILFFENNIYLECYDTKNYKIRKLVLDKIDIIEQQPLKNKNIKMSNSAVFEISGKLASTYKLKEGETILAQHSQKIFVKNENEDFEFLAKRLIRYQRCCKVLQPQEFVEYFKNYTNKILDVYKSD